MADEQGDHSKWPSYMDRVQLAGLAYDNGVAFFRVWSVPTNVTYAALRRMARGKANPNPLAMAFFAGHAAAEASRLGQLEADLRGLPAPSNTLLDAIQSGETAQ